MRKRWAARLTALALGTIAVTSTASAYYYYVTYNSRSAPFNPIVEKFDLNALTNKTVPVFISDQGPSIIYTGDTYQSIVGEIRGAAEVWNNVATSDLRLAYGGLFTVGTPQSAPGIDVEFSDDIPPGLLALGGPQTTSGLSFGQNGPFIPITRSRVVLHRDLSQQIATYGIQAASFSEQFFITLVHEFGHALGLQHTLTSGVMSTLWTTASTKATPLGADDIAGISLLYPAGNYLSTVGSIGGRVTLSGNGVNVASVVAISSSNPAISTLTNPDGTYQINGIPPGQYYVYVHPLPPALQGESSPANITYPKDGNGSPFNTYTVFQTQFYNGGNGTRDQSQAHAVFVYAANQTSGINFNVNKLSTSAPPVYAVRTYGFSQTNVAEIAPPLSVGLTAPVAATGVGLLQSNNTVMPGLSVDLLGTAARVSNLRPYPPPTPYIAVDVLVNFASGPGAKHLLFSTANDLYVLPSGFTVVNSAPPMIASVSPTRDASGNWAVLIAGTGFAPDTRFVFDGLAGVVQQVTPDGRLLVTPPQAPGSYTVTVVALNPDGQSSLFVQQTPPTYTYDYADTTGLTVSPPSISAGADTAVDVVATGTPNFDAGTVVGFGTSDIAVKKVTVLSPNHLSVLVTPSTNFSTAGISVTNGLRIISQALGNPVTVTTQSSRTR